MTASACRKAADDCEREAARVTQIAHVRQFRLLAHAWLELAKEIDQRAPEEGRTFATYGD